MKKRDLSKIKEVASVSGRSSIVNERLSDGWILLDVKIVERQGMRNGGPEKGIYPYKEAETVYVIGRTD